MLHQLGLPLSGPALPRCPVLPCMPTLCAGPLAPRPPPPPPPPQVGPRMSFSTAWCANALSICTSCGLGKVDRIEVSRRYLLRASAPLSADERAKFAALVHDRMTEQVRGLARSGLRAWIDRRARVLPVGEAAQLLAGRTCGMQFRGCCPTPWGGQNREAHEWHRPRLQVYPEPLRSFASDQVPAPVITIPVVEQGRAALEAINKVRSCLHATASCVQPNKITPVRHWL